MRYEPQTGLGVHLRLDLPALAGKTDGFIYPDILLSEALSSIRTQIADGHTFGEVSTTAPVGGSYTRLTYGTWEVTTSDGEPVADVFESVFGEIPACVA